MIETKFKETGVGLVPEDWVVKKLANVVEVKRGVRVTRNNLSNNGLYPVYQNTNYPMGFYNKFNVNENNPFVIIGGSAGLLGYSKTKFWAADDCAYFGDSNKLDKGFLYYNLLNRQQEIKNCVKTGTVPRLDRSSLEVFQLILPPTLSEQRRIASALSSVDSLISNLDTLIEKKRNIKQGAMQQLLTGKTRLKGFDEPWVEKKLGEIGYTYNGLTGKSASDFGSGNASYITFLNILNNVRIDTRILGKVDVESTEKQNAVQKGDLFFNTSSETPEEVGICSVLLEDIAITYLNSFCFGYRIVDTEVLGLYLSYYFRSEKGRQLMSFLAQGSTRYNLSKDSFIKSSICIPATLSEQSAIASILTSMDDEIAKLEQKREKYVALKQGMMQQLLTGKIRLTD
jgi:type I restriction enzyme, S subunit